MLRTSASLLLRLKQNRDPESWNRFVRLYTPLLHMQARKLGLQDSDIDDLVQDVFLQLYHELPKFDYNPQKKFRAWLTTVLQNKNHERKRRRAEIPLDNETAPFAQLTAVEDNELEEAEYRQYLTTRALQLIQTDFASNTWKAFWETTMKEKAVAEVADELGMTIHAVYLARSRVLQRLRQEFQGLLD